MTKTKKRHFGECRRTPSVPGSWDDWGDTYGAQEAPYMAWGRRKSRALPLASVRCQDCGDKVPVPTVPLVKARDPQRLTHPYSKYRGTPKHWAVITQEGLYCTACYRVGTHPPRGRVRKGPLPDPATCDHDQVYLASGTTYCLNCGAEAKKPKKAAR